MVTGPVVACVVTVPDVAYVVAGPAIHCMVAVHGVA